MWPCVHNYDFAMQHKVILFVMFYSRALLEYNMYLRMLAVLLITKFQNFWRNFIISRQ
jgi:hypothetical protein